MGTGIGGIGKFLPGVGTLIVGTFIAKVGGSISGSSTMFTEMVGIMESPPKLALNWGIGEFLPMPGRSINGAFTGAFEFETFSPR